MGLVVAILGAQGTGKTTLAASLGEALRREGHDAAVVPDHLREFREHAQRMPRVDEQRFIADEQTRRIAAAACAHDIVVADTSALMVAVYSDQVFGDPSLYEPALAAHRQCQLSLLTALDLPCPPDGLQRDGPQLRETVDALVRSALLNAGLGFSVVAGQGPARLEAALAAVRHLLKAPSDDAQARGNPRWQWACERCSDGECERHLFRLG